MHTALQAYHKFFTASDEHRMITHTRGRTRTCVYAHPSKKIYRAQFFFTIKPNPKNGTGFVGFDILKWTSLGNPVMTWATWKTNTSMSIFVFFCSTVGVSCRLHYCLNSFPHLLCSVFTFCMTHQPTNASSSFQDAILIRRLV